MRKKILLLERLKYFYKYLLVTCLTLLSLLVNATTALEEKRAWITTDQNALNHINQSKNQIFDLKTVESKNQKNIAIVSLPESQLRLLSKMMHESFNRCGGFFYHSSLSEAQNHEKKLTQLTAKNKIIFPYSISNAEVVNAMLAQISLQNMQATVDGMSNYYNRYYTTQTGKDSSNWLLQHWQNITAGRADINVELFNHSWSQPSVVLTVEGATNPEQVVVIGGHLDSINGANQVNGRAPGADDNASGIAVITETLSAIVASDFRPARTLKIIGYAAEEVGLRGSQSIARLYKNNNVDVIGVAQFDMTGFKGSSQADIVFISDYTNNAQTEFMVNLIDTYFPETKYQYDQCGYACSDHASWTAEGFAASFPFEARFADSNSSMHTSADTSFDTTHAKHFLQLSIAYVAELAKGNTGEESNTTLQFNSSTQSIESGKTITIALQRTGASDSAVSIGFATENGTASAGTDFIAASGTVTWEANDNSDKTITIETLKTSSNKQFQVKLINPQGGVNIGPNDVIEITLESSVILPPPASSSSGGGNLGVWTILGLLLVAFGQCLRLFLVKYYSGIFDVS
ncbi:M20/M25/M40 family metallo-hydrolase [Aliikangiella sp. IMCC44359]|uniref:M20/M25/M40 family metallo-hydrolase n=1 Tax=Aliikangiella sp. IMCC44359 TaxID=3459125 RepID=UPI00403AA117